MPLVLKLKAQESIQVEINGEVMDIMLDRAGPDYAYISFDASMNVKLVRKELLNGPVHTDSKRRSADDNAGDAEQGRPRNR